MYPRHDLLDALLQRRFALVEPIHVLTLAGIFPLLLAELDIAAHRHPVANIVGQEGEPLLEAALVEQGCLRIEKLLDLPRQQQVLETTDAILGLLYDHGVSHSSIQYDTNSA